jgi:hypothetical protein
MPSHQEINNQQKPYFSDFKRTKHSDAFKLEQKKRERAEWRGDRALDECLCKVLGDESPRESTCRVRFRYGRRWRKQGGHVESMRAHTFFLIILIFVKKKTYLLNCIFYFFFIFLYIYKYSLN